MRGRDFAFGGPNICIGHIISSKEIISLHQVRRDDTCIRKINVINSRGHAMIDGSCVVPFKCGLHLILTTSQTDYCDLINSPRGHAMIYGICVVGYLRKAVCTSF